MRFVRRMAAQARVPASPLGWSWLAFGLAAALLLAVGLIGAADLGRSRAVAAVTARAEDGSTLAIAILRGELEKQRALPVILARDPDVRSALSGGSRHTLDLKFASIARETRTAVIYLLDVAGMTIAASNWDEPTSFVGNDYAFRDYYLGAILKGSAEQFALGTVSQRPGLYLTSRIKDGERLLGVVVVKVEFDRVEADWRALGGQIYVADQRGVVLLSTTADWRFHVETPLDEETQKEIRRSLQFGEAPLQPLPLTQDGDLVQSTAPARALNVLARRDVPTTSWHLDMLLPVDQAIRAEQSRLQTLVAFVLLVGLLLAALLLRRRQQARRRRRSWSAASRSARQSSPAAIESFWRRWPSVPARRCASWTCARNWPRPTAWPRSVRSRRASRTRSTSRLQPCAHMPRTPAPSSPARIREARPARSARSSG